MLLDTSRLIFILHSLNAILFSLDHRLAFEDLTNIDALMYMLLLLSPGELTGFLLRTVWLQREAKRPTTKGLRYRVFTIEFPAQSSHMS